MRNFKAELIKDVELQQNLLKQYEKELISLPEGSLSRYKVGQKMYYKYTLKKDGRRIQRNVKKGEEELIAALCKKAMLRSTIHIIRNNLRLQKEVLASYRSYSPDEVLKDIRPVYYDGLSIAKENEGIRKKQEASIEQAIRPERLTQPTLAGFCVRSKSEAIIVNMMAGRNVRFVYEEPFSIDIPGRGRAIVHPDFVIYLNSGEIIIWEHMGMLSVDSYADAQTKKIQMYHQAGYTLGKNLFLTADDADGTLDISVISRIIDVICERGGCYSV